MRSLAILVGLFLVLTPAAAAGSTYSYVAGPAGLGCHAVPGHPLPFPPSDDPLCVGAVAVAVDAPSGVAVAANDLAYGDAVSLTVCMTGEPNDPCEDGTQSTGCGAQFVPALPFAASHVIVYVQPLVVTEDLSMCGASAGTLAIYAF